MHFSFVKPSLHPTRIVSTKKAAKPKFGLQKNSATITHQSHLNRPVMTSMPERAALRFLSNQVLGLHYGYALPVPVHVFCCKDQLGMSLLDGRCVQLEFGAACGSTS